MSPIKLRIINQFGASEFLGAPDEIEVHLPYESMGSLVKRLSNGAVKILDDSKGEISVELTPFEVQGLIIGDQQNFSVKIISGSKIREAIFPKSLNVRTIDIGGELRKVIAK